MSQIDTIYSTFDQLTTWEQYRDLLIETLTASGYPNLDAVIRSEFTPDHFLNPELLAQFIVPLFSPHQQVANDLYSGTDPLNLLIRVDRTRQLIVNGTFNTDLTGWIDASEEGFEATWEDGVAQFNGGGEGKTSRLRQEVVSLEAGQYQFTFTGTTTPLALGFTPAGDQVSGYSPAKDRTFTYPETRTLWVNFATVNVETIDNVSLRRID